MLNNAENKKIKLITNFIYYFLIVFIIYIALRYVFKLIFPFIAAIIIALAVEPFVRFFCGKLKIKRCIASAFCVIVFYALFTLLIALLTSALTMGIKVYSENIRLVISQITQLSKNLQSKSKIISLIYDFIANYDIKSLFTGSIGGYIIKPISEIIKTIPSFMFSALITLISSFFASSSLPQIKEFIFDNIIKNSKPRLINNLKECKKTIKKYIKTYSILTVITFCELLLFFTLFKINPPVILAFIIALIDVLPVLGVGTVLIPWSIISFILSNKMQAIILLAIYIFVTVVRQIVESNLVGKSIGINPFFTLLLIYTGLKFFGIFGAFILPFTATIIYRLYVDKRKTEGYNKLKSE